MGLYLFSFLFFIDSFDTKVYIDSKSQFGNTFYFYRSQNVVFVKAHIKTNTNHSNIIPNFFRPVLITRNFLSNNESFFIIINCTPDGNIEIKGNVSNYLFAGSFCYIGKPN